MAKRISTLEVRRCLGDMLNKVHLRDNQYIIERKGVLLAALVPVWQLEKWENGSEMFFKKINEIRGKNIDIPEEEINRDIDEAVKYVRKHK